MEPILAPVFANCFSHVRVTLRAAIMLLLRTAIISKVISEMVRYVFAILLRFSCFAFLRSCWASGHGVYSVMPAARNFRYSAGVVAWARLVTDPAERAPTGAIGSWRGSLGFAGGADSTGSLGTPL